MTFWVMEYRVTHPSIKLKFCLTIRLPLVAETS
jgi:hypothetical protein